MQILKEVLIDLGYTKFSISTSDGMAKDLFGNTLTYDTVLCIDMEEEDAVIFRVKQDMNDLNNRVIRQYAETFDSWTDATWIG
jgi:hypothetical protein